MISKFYKIQLFLFVVLFVGMIQTNSYSQTKIASLYSHYSEKNPDINSHKVIDEITLWEIFLMQEKISYNVIYDSDLESGIVGDFDILVLPNVNSISEDEINSIKEFLQNGNSVLCVGSRLSLDEKGNFIGNDNTNDLFGIRVKEYFKKELSLFQSWSLDPSFLENLNSIEIQISTKYRPLICYEFGLKASPLGLIKEGKNLNSAIAYGQAEKGKFIWLGFNFDDVSGGNLQEKDLRNFIKNAFNWLDKTPDIYIANFPDNKNSALVIALQNSPNLKSDLIEKLLKDGREPYLLLSPEQTLAQAIKTKLNDDNLILDLSNLVYPSENIVQTFKDEILKSSNKFGIKFDKVIIPQMMINDMSVLREISEVGINYFLYHADNSALPMIVSNKYFILPLKIYSDEKTLAGTDFVLYNPKEVCEGNPEESFLNIISKIDKAENWITDLKSLKSCWLNKAEVNASIKLINQTFALITLTNKGGEEISGLNLILNWPFDLDKNYFSVSEGVDLFDYTFSKTGEIKININKLGSYQFRRITVNFNQE